MSRWVLVLPIEKPLMTPNEQRRAHWTKVAKAKADTEFLVGAAARRCGLVRVTPPVVVQIVWYARDARRRDVDSLGVLAKSALDALQKCNIIEDDNSRFVERVVLGPIVIARDNPRVEVVVDEQAG